MGMRYEENVLFCVSLRSRILLCLVSIVLCFITMNVRRYLFDINSTETIDISYPARVANKSISAQEERLDSEATRRISLYNEYLKMVARHERNTTRQKRLPDIIGIGAEKCGSGALRSMLLQHPMVLSSNPREMHYFSSPKYGDINNYISHMPEATSYELIFEKTPAYFTSDIAASLIRQDIPEGRILLVLCDPVNRTFSDYVQEVTLKTIRGIDFETLVHNLLDIFSPVLKKQAPDFNAALDFIYKINRRNPASHVISTGLYYYHLKTWFKELSPSNIHVVDGEELITNPGAELEKVQEFLHIPKLIIQKDFVKGPNGFFCYAGPKLRKVNNRSVLMQPQNPICMPNSSKGRTRLGNWDYNPSTKLVNELRRFYEPYNQKLFELLGRKFRWTEPLT